jgi:ubiquinone/menaquinone biosynthesis C-methylase UbiE
MKDSSTFQDHTLEDQILLLALRPGDSADIQPDLKQYLLADFEWSDLVRKAVMHQVVPLVGMRLIQIGSSLVPSDIIEALNIRMQRNRDQFREFEVSLAEIAHELSGHSVEVFLIEGPMVSHAIYGEDALREASEPILFVPFRNLEVVNKLLASLDYRLEPADNFSVGMSPWMNDSSIRSYVRIGSANRSHIKIITELLPPHASGVFDYRAFTKRAKDFDDHESPLKMPCLEDLLILRSVRGGMLDWADLIDLCDIAWLLHRHTETDIESAIALAEKSKVERFLLLALNLAQSIFGIASNPLISLEDHTSESISRFFAPNLLQEPKVIREKQTPSWAQLKLRTTLGTRSLYFARALRELFNVAKQPNKHSTLADSAPTATAINNEYWSKRSDSWQKWSDQSRDRSAEISRVLINTAGIKSGYRVLDIACGVGDTSLELFRWVGSNGAVVATDLSLDMIYRARRRGITDSHTNLMFCTAAMENLPFEDACFDGIVCRLGIMYCPKVQAALSEALRILRPGGRVAYLVCGPRNDNPILRIVNEVATELFDLPSGDGTIDPFRFSTEGSLAKKMEMGGFVDVEEGDLISSQHIPIGSIFWRAGFERGSSLDMDDLPAVTKAELERRMTLAFEPYRNGDFYELKSLSRITSGAHP